VKWELPGDYRIDDDPGCIDRDLLFTWLSTDAYWWTSGLDRHVMEKAIDGSITLSIVSSDGSFVGFGRLVTDRATFAYLCDVYVDREHRGQGLGRQLALCAAGHPEVSTCRRVLLATLDAHGVYQRAGFVTLAHPERFMELDRGQQIDR
jgi:GNAT superfamily N-acetyltransferase